MLLCYGHLYAYPRLNQPDDDDDDDDDDDLCFAATFVHIVG